MLMTIAEMSRRTGVAATALRHYDAVGVLTPLRMGNGHRRYPVEAVERLVLIRLCQAVGCSLDEIRRIMAPGGGAVRGELARSKLADVEGQLRQLAAARAVLTHLVDCAHTELESAACNAVVRELLARSRRDGVDQAGHVAQGDHHATSGP